MVLLFLLKEPKTGVGAALARTDGVKLMYVAEIVPPADTAVEAFHSQVKEVEEEKKEGDNELKILMEVEVQSATFTGLKPNKAYSMKVISLFNI